jgi:hypothetical protein
MVVAPASKFKYWDNNKTILPDGFNPWAVETIFSAVDLGD